jgi:hypothetical protein
MKYVLSMLYIVGSPWALAAAAVLAATAFLLGLS